LQPPLGYTEEYQVDQVAGISSSVTCTSGGAAGSYPVLKKVYQTPEGPLSQAVKVTDDWPYGQNIMLFNDFNIPRQVEPLIKNKDDVRRLRHLLKKPNDSQSQAFYRQANLLHQEANRLGVALDGGWSALGDAAVWLCGMEQVLYGQMENVDLLESLLDVLLEWELMRIDYLLQAGMDMMVHMAWYEGTDFWTPKNFRKLLKPRLKQIVEKVHGANVPLRYIITKGWMPLRRDLLEMGVDCIMGVDPVQDHIVLEDVNRELGGRIGLMGGINGGVMLACWEEKEIRNAVDVAMKTLGELSGFILFPVDNVQCELPWEKVNIVIDQWKSHWEK
jgi:hypothetical protein